MKGPRRRHLGLGDRVVDFNPDPARLPAPPPGQMDALSAVAVSTSIILEGDNVQKWGSKRRLVIG